jgi:hypothetical protein
MGRDVINSAVSSVREKRQSSGALTSTERDNLKPSDFVFPKTRRYPIADIGNGRAALRMVGKNGTESEKRIVRAAVHRRYPQLKSMKEE